MKKNGFVFMETIIVICVLSITLLLLFASYSFILKKSKQKNMYDTTELIYKTFYVKQAMENYKREKSGSGNSVLFYVSNHTSNHECTKSSYGNSYTCKIKDDNSYLINLSYVFEIDKFYYINPYEVMNSSNWHEWLLELDATTIDYVRQLKDQNRYLLVVKYKKVYSDNTYEVYHASMEA